MIIASYVRNNIWGNKIKLRTYFWTWKTLGLLKGRYHRQSVCQQPKKVCHLMKSCYYLNLVKLGRISLTFWYVIFVEMNWFQRFTGLLFFQKASENLQETYGFLMVSGGNRMPVNLWNQSISINITYQKMIGNLLSFQSIFKKTLQLIMSILEYENDLFPSNW